MFHKGETVKAILYTVSANICNRDAVVVRKE
jgi:hypothetical protein